VCQATPRRKKKNNKPKERNTTPKNAIMNPDGKYTKPKKVNKLKNIDAICAHTKTKREIVDKHIHI